MATALPAVDDLIDQIGYETEELPPHGAYVLALAVSNLRAENETLKSALEATERRHTIDRGFERARDITDRLAAGLGHSELPESTGPNPPSLAFVSAMAALDPSDDFDRQLAEIDRLIDGPPPTPEDLNAIQARRDDDADEELIREAIEREEAERYYVDSNETLGLSMEVPW